MMLSSRLCFIKLHHPAMTYGIPKFDNIQSGRILDHTLKQKTRGMLRVANITLGITFSGYIGYLYLTHPKLQIDVVSQIDSNSDMATSLDILFIQDREISAVLPTNAPEWFAKKAMLIHASGEAFDLLSLEIPPGSATAHVTLPESHSKATQVVAYANYLSKSGQTKLTLPTEGCVSVELKKAGIATSACEKRGPLFRLTRLILNGVQVVVFALKPQ